MPCIALGEGVVKKIDNFGVRTGRSILSEKLSLHSNILLKDNCTVGFNKFMQTWHLTVQIMEKRRSLLR